MASPTPFAHLTFSIEGHDLHHEQSHEVDSFNASKETREHGEDSRTQKEKRARFLSFMDLLKKDSLVYKNWEIFSRKFVEMVKWLYLVYLNYERLDEIPPRVGVDDGRSQRTVAVLMEIYPHGQDKGRLPIEEAHENGLIIKTQFGVKLESNIEEDAEQGSIIDSNDFEIIV
ncbi:hypothetical protein Tco_0774151 [Tanacetum coccineum]|uniref:Uncharacterized protein n=1 Tax=Tanacetum coccineum TaxID=301880 RepID=A0ABQ4ZMS2_9ASTR